MKSRLLNYLPACVLCAIIFANVNFGYYLRKALVERFGDPVFNLIYFILAAITLYVVVVIFRSRKKRALRFALLACLIAGYIRSLMTIKYGVDKVHYFEYGLLGMLLYSAFSKDFSSIAALGLSMLLLFCAGLADEFIQHFSALRVAEMGDVLLDVKAGAFGLIFGLLIRPPALVPAAFSRREGRILLAGLFISAAGAFLFIEHVHGYGYIVSEPGSYAFYSGLGAEELAGANLRMKEGAAVSPGTRKIYDNEACRHLFQRDFYLKNKFYYDPANRERVFIEYGKSFRENAILERYFSFYLDSTRARWDGATQGLVNKAQWPETGWHSRVKETVIIRFSRATVRCAFAGLMLLISFGVILTFRRRDKS